MQLNIQLWVLSLLALIGGARVCVHALTFPFFGHVDEIQHVDVLMNYASFELPDIARDAYRPQTLWLESYYKSPEYVQPGLLPFPPVLWPSEVRASRLDEFMELVAIPDEWNHNYEAMQPPVYYAAATVWMYVGRALGFAGGLVELYWVRCFGAVLTALLVVLAYVWVRRVVPDASAMLPLGAAATLAFAPQDCFYFVSNDGMGAVMAALLLVLLAEWRRLDRRGSSSIWIGLVVGAAVSATLLVKVTNLPVFVPLGFVLFVRARERWKAGQRIFDAAHTAMWGTMLVPLAAWSVHALAVSGEIFGTRHKTEFCGYGEQSWGGVLAHPMWSFEGSWTFLSRLSARFWRGEIHWNGIEMGVFAVDASLCVASLVFVIVSGFATMRRRSGAIPMRAAALLWGVALTALAMMFGLSLYWDYSGSVNPSRDCPYMISGRLIACAMMPFAVLFVDGLTRCTQRLGRLVPVGVLVALLIALVWSEIVLMLPVFASPYNFWNLDV